MSWFMGVPYLTGQITQDSDSLETLIMDILYADIWFWQFYE